MFRLFAGTWVMSFPPTRIRPWSTSSSPPSARSAVVLPQPDGPRSAISSPGGDIDRESVKGVHGAVPAVHLLELDGDTVAGRDRAGAYGGHAADSSASISPR